MPAVSQQHGSIKGQQPNTNVTSIQSLYKPTSSDVIDGCDSESSYNILQCVKDQEAQLELLTRELELERRNVVSQLERCTVQGHPTCINSEVSIVKNSGIGMPRDLNQHSVRYGDQPHHPHHHHHHHRHNLHQSEELDDSSNYSWRLAAEESGDYDYGGATELQPLINRKVETTVNQKIERKETTASRRVLPDKGNSMPQYYPYSMPYYGGGGGEPQVQTQENNYSVNVTYRPMTSPSPTTVGNVGGSVNSRPPNPANGYTVNNPVDEPSPNSSQLSMHSADVPGGGHPQLVSRTTTKNSTQQVTTVTKVIKSRELRHIGPDGQPLDFDPVTGAPYGTVHNMPPPPNSDYASYGYGGGIVTDPSARSDYGTYDSGRPPSPGVHDNPDHDFMTYGRPHSPGSEASSRRNYDSYPSPHRSSSYNDYDPHLHTLPPQSSGRGPNNSDYGTYNPRQDGHGGYTGIGGNVDARGLVGGVGGGVISRQGNYGGVDHLTAGVDRPPTPPSPTSEASASPLPQRATNRNPGSAQGGPAPYPLSGYEELDNTLLMSGPPRNADLYDTYDPQNGRSYGMSPFVSDQHGQPSYADQFSPTLYEEDDQHYPTIDDHEQPHDDRAQQQNSDIRWRDPDLSEVIDFLQHPNNIVKANAAAYLQHLCYSDDQVKQKARTLGGIPPLVALLNHDIPEVHRNACGALRNLSYGRQNDENKRAIKNASGIPSLVRLLRKTPDNEVRELVTGILWNLSSSEDLKKAIIDDGLTVLINMVIIPHSGWDRNMDASETPKPSEIYWSTVFRNASGVLRNVSSAGTYARCKLRECDCLVDALLYLVKAAIGKNDIDNKSVENCVCVLRNLSYRCQEVEDPNYDRHELQPQPRASSFPVKAGENLGCFGGSKKKKEMQNPEKQRKEGAVSASPRLRQEPIKGMELLWQPEVVQPYLSLLSDCSNPETLEGAAGAIQNLAACYWQPSIDIRAAVRKDKGLPILVELLRMEVDRVVCAVATALRNLALDQRNKELIGKYAMRDLVQKLPSEQQQHDTGTSDETYAAVLATLNEVVRKSAEFSRSLLESSGVDRLMYITRQRGGRFSPKVVKFASQVLYNLWQHQEMREAYKKHGWKESNFVTRTMAARSLSPNNANSTLNRPMSSQGGTKYEDKTLQRPREPNPASIGAGAAAAAALRSPENSGYSRQQQLQQHQQPTPQIAIPSEEVPLADMPYPVESSHRPPVGGVQVFPPGIRSPNEPVYAQVNREKKKLRQYDGDASYDTQYQHHRSYNNQSDVEPNTPTTNWDYERQQQHQRLLASSSSTIGGAGGGGNSGGGGHHQHQQSQHPGDPDGQHGGDSWV